MQSTCHWIAGLRRRKTPDLQAFATRLSGKCDPPLMAATSPAQLLCDAHRLSESQILDANSREGPSWSNG
jgi:hypothetical protein